MYGQGLGRSSLSTLSVLLVEVWRNDYDYLPKGGERRGGGGGCKPFPCSVHLVNNVQTWLLEEGASSL